MCKKQLGLGMLVSLMFVCLAGNAFAGVGVGSEAGVDVKASQKAIAAASNFDYDSETLLLVGTEAGVDVKASQKALDAARGYQYDPVISSLIATEAGVNSLGSEKYGPERFLCSEC